MNLKMVSYVCEQKVEKMNDSLQDFVLLSESSVIHKTHPTLCPKAKPVPNPDPKSISIPNPHPKPYFKKPLKKS